MTQAAANPVLTRWTNRILIGLFMVFIWLPTVDTFFHFDHARQPTEKRLLAAFPKLTSGVDGLRKYLAGLDAYFSDHFGCRKLLVSWNNKLKWKLFHDFSTHGTLIGRDGWFFFAGDQMVEHQCGALQFTPEQLRDWQDLLERRRDWLAQRDIKFLFVVAPDKASVYPDELPSWMPQTHPATKIDQFVAYMKAHSTVEVLDLRGPLRAARRTAPTYFKTDTHWNLFGSFIGYQEIIKALACQLPGLTSLPLDAFEQKKVLRPGGNETTYLGTSATESNAVVFTPKVGLPPLQMTANPLDLAYEAPAFTTNAQASGSLIVFRDSFGNALEGFLGYNFAKVTYLWQYDLDTARIEREKPNAVIVEMYEQHFDVTDPKDLMHREALP
jgi:hypothetical protein